eukprot:271032-Pyramimonas_sp.AAC.1
MHCELSHCRYWSVNGDQKTSSPTVSRWHSNAPRVPRYGICCSVPAAWRVTAASVRGQLHHPVQPAPQRDGAGRTVATIRSVTFCVAVKLGRFTTLR